MDLAISTFAAVRRPLQEAAADLLAAGVGIEIMCEPPHAWPPPVVWPHGRVVALHTPILGLNIASTNPGIRNESVAQVIATIHEAARLGARGVVVHPGIPPYQEVFPREAGVPHAVASLRRCADAAAAAGIELYLENMPAVALADGAPRIGFAFGVRYEELRELFEQVGHPALRLCLDVAHAYLAGPEVLQALLADPDVVHVHVNDNHGRRDDHLAWGDGEISRTVDLQQDLPPWVRTVVMETATIDAARRSLERAGLDVTQRRPRR